MDIEKIKNYWVEEATEALMVTWHLYEKGDYSYALFFAHLAVEKQKKRTCTLYS
jgi:HEPN domain-containing protein